MSTSSQKESPRRQEGLLTSDTFLLTPFSTQIGAEEQQPRLPPQIAALEEDFFKTRRPHQISSIDSLLSFVNYYSGIPVGNIPNLYAEENVSGFLYDPDVSILGMGMSFVVQAERSYPIPEYILERLPSWQKRASKPSCVAIKVPRIDRRESLHPDENVEKRCLRAIAWECHVLSHPSIRECKNIISMFGLTWRPAFAGKGGKRRLLPSLVLEFASEGNLSNFFKSSAFCLAYATKLGVVLDIARGLEVLHRHGIIHGDVKAENVLLTFDSDGMLIAKLADFACSIHDFGDAGQQWMPGKSPPWDAPEVRHGAVARSKAHKTDIYSFGLLTWRIMLECRTPFDNTTGLKEYSAFEDISQASGQIEKMFLVQNLKEKEDDELLTRIKTSIPGHGLNESQVFEFLNCTVRFHPKDRLDSIGEIFEKSGSSGGPTQMSKFASNQLSVPDSKLLTIMPDVKSESIARFSVGFVGSEPYIPRILRSLSEKPIPDEVQRHILEDLEAESDQDSVVHAALCYFTGFGCSKNYDLGLKCITRAAFAGDVRARAVFMRLHQACAREMPAEVPILDWLVVATALGSKIASSDLLRTNRAQHARALRCFQSLWNRQAPWSYTDQTAIEEARSAFNVTDDSNLAETIQRLLSLSQNQGAQSIEDIECRGWNMLHFAATFGYVSMLQKLLELGAHVNHQNSYGATALLCACRSNRLFCVEILLDNGADPSIPDRSGSTALHYMIFMDEKDIPYISSRLVANGADVGAKSIPYHPIFQFIGESEGYCDTPLHWAVSAGRLDVCQNLLRHGANPLETSGVYDALEFFEINGHSPYPKPPSTAEMAATTPLYDALSHAQIDMVDLFMRHILSSDFLSPPDLSIMGLANTPTLIHMCLHGKDYSDRIIRTCYRMEPNPNYADLLGRAILWNSDVLVQHVLKQGYNVNEVITSAGLTPIQLSCTRENGWMSMFLLQNGADPRLRGPKCPVSCMALHAMRPIGTHGKEIASALIQKGCTYENEPGAVKGMYRRAVKDGWNDVASELLSCGCDKTEVEDGLLSEILSQNSEASIGPLMFLLEPYHQYGSCSPMSETGATCFHQLGAIAEYTRDDDLNWRIGKYLISKFPQVDLLNMPNGRGNTAIAMAASKGNHLLVSELLQAGADPFAGCVSAIMWITDRILHQDDFGGGFAGIARRTSQAIRYEENSLKTLKALIAKQRSPAALAEENNQRDQLRELVQKWRLAGWEDRISNEALTRHYGWPITCRVVKGRLWIDDSTESVSRPATLPEMKLVTMQHWECIVRECEDAISRN